MDSPANVSAQVDRRGFLTQGGIDNEKLLQALRNGLEARKWQGGRKGEMTADFPTQLKAVEICFKMLGYLQPDTINPDVKIVIVNYGDRVTEGNSATACASLPITPMAIGSATEV